MESGKDNHCQLDIQGFLADACLALGPLHAACTSARSRLFACLRTQIARQTRLSLLAAAATTRPAELRLLCATRHT